jgi:hypothetical protein
VVVVVVVSVIGARYWQMAGDVTLLNCLWGEGVLALHATKYSPLLRTHTHTHTPHHHRRASVDSLNISFFKCHTDAYKREVRRSALCRFSGELVVTTSHHCSCTVRCVVHTMGHHPPKRISSISSLRIDRTRCSDTVTMICKSRGHSC